MEFRKEMLHKLLVLDEEIFPDRQRRVVTEDELKHIQHRWLKEGDFELTVLKELDSIQGRTIELLDETHELLALCLIAKNCVISNCENMPNEKNLMSYFNGEMCDRFYAQLAIQLERRVAKPTEYLLALSSPMQELSKSNVTFDEAFSLVLTLPCMTTQFYPTKEQEALIRREWETDQVTIATSARLDHEGLIPKPEKTLFGYDGVHEQYYKAKDMTTDGALDVSLHMKLDMPVSDNIEEQIMFMEDIIESDRAEIAKQRRTNVEKGRDPNEGVELMGDVIHFENMGKGANLKVVAKYATDDENTIDVALLYGKKGVTFLDDIINEETLPKEVLNIITDKNEFLTAEKKRLAENEKKRAKASAKKSAKNKR